MNSIQQRDSPSYSQKYQRHHGYKDVIGPLGKFPHPVLLFLLDGREGVAGLLEGLGGVPARELHDLGDSARMLVHVVGHVVDRVVDYYPAALLGSLGFDQVRADGPANLHHRFLVTLVALELGHFLQVALGVVLGLELPHAAGILEADCVVGVLGLVELLSRIQAAHSMLAIGGTSSGSHRRRGAPPGSQSRRRPSGRWPPSSCRGSCACPAPPSSPSVLPCSSLLLACQYGIYKIFKIFSQFYRLSRVAKLFAHGQGCYQQNYVIKGLGQYKFAQVKYTSLTILSTQPSPRRADPSQRVPGTGRGLGQKITHTSRQGRKFKTAPEGRQKMKYQLINYSIQFLFNGIWQGLQLIILEMNDKNSNPTMEILPVKCPSYARIGHKVLRIGQDALIFGGTGPHGESVRAVLRFNLQNQKMEVVLNSQCPQLEGFSLFACKDTVYLWGGNLENKPCNLLWAYQGSTFEECPQLGHLPAPRGFHSSAFVANRYLLVFGGFNQHEIFNDWFVLDTQTLRWSKAEANLDLPKNIKYTMVWEAGRGYLVSEYQVSKKMQRSFAEVRNDIYEFRVTSFTNFKIRIDKLEPTEGECPVARTNFSLFSINNELWLLGGQIFIDNQLSFCDDVWCFDVEALAWTRRKPLVSLRTGFEVLHYDRRLFLIGGIKSGQEMANTVEIVSIKQSLEYESKVCSFCRNVYSFQQVKKAGKVPAFCLEVREPTEVLTQISTNFISKLAHYLQNPIQAIGLLVDNSLNMGASLTYINIYNVELSAKYFKQPEAYLYIGDNSKSFANEEILRIVYAFRFKVEKLYGDSMDKEDIKMRNEYGLNLKMASLRLGSGCLFVTATISEDIFVAYFSDNDTHCPDGDPSFNCFYYYISQAGACSNPLNRQIIKENVKHLVSQPEYLNTAQHSTKTYIFGLKDIKKADNKLGKSDIVYLHTTSMSCLSEYVSLMYLGQFKGRVIYVQDNKIAFVAPLSRFKEDQKVGLLQEIDTLPEMNNFQKISLYRVLKSSYASNYVYIYHQKRLIYTISSRDRSVCGYIEIPELIEIDFFKSKLEKWEEERKLIAYIDSKEQPRRRHRKIEGLDPEEQPRKVKAFAMEV